MLPQGQQGLSIVVAWGNGNGMCAAVPVGVFWFDQQRACGGKQQHCGTVHACDTQEWLRYESSYLPAVHLGGVCVLKLV